MSPQITIDSGEEFTELGGGILSHINECECLRIQEGNYENRRNKIKHTHITCKWVKGLREAYCVAENDME